MTALWVVVIVAVLLVIGVGTWTYKQQQSRRIREQFGPEYTRMVKEYGDARHAEPILEARARRVKALDIRPLPENDRARFADVWRKVQAQFVDDPSGAITRADQVVGEVMQARGYPMGDFEQRAADISVDHASVVQQYRAAHDIAMRHEQGEASTEDLRQGLVHYRALFEDLLGSKSRELVEAR